jgi:hypothetical protein
MPNLPVRNLGGAGIVSDIHPYDLPPNVFSAGVNVRFENGTVSRAPVMREVFDLTADFDPDFSPSYIFSIPPVAGSAEAIVLVANDYSQVVQIIGSTPTDITPPTVDVGDIPAPYSHASLGGVSYLNRRSNAPFQKTAADTTFVDLAFWDPDWRCSILRPYKDFLIALNVTKGANDFPSLVKWSDFAQYGSPPPSWDEGDPMTSAGENVLNQMQGSILDGAVLRDTFMIYGENEVWAMTYTGGSFIFDFRKRFDDVGVINTNCVVEIDGQHYVFDRNDLIVHDGASKRSIAHGKNKDFIFSSLNRDLSHLCFVSHNAKLNEIHFCYPSGDRLTGFENPETGCNRAAVYNYRRDTWTFYDLPNVTAATYSVVASGATYDSVAPTPYKEMGGTYAGTGDQSEKHQLFASRLSADQGITASRVLGQDLITGGRLTKPVVPELLKDAFVERIGIDLDETGANISSYKSLLKVYPQIAILNGASGVTFQFGANDTSGVSPSWDTPQPFDPEVSYQLPVRKAGRYLAHRLKHTGTADFSYSGFDATLTLRGKR